MARVHDANKESTDPMSALKKINGINFQKFLEDFNSGEASKKLHKINCGHGQTKMQNSKNRLAEMIVESKGLSDFVALKTWMNNKDEFKEGKTIQKEINELLVFTEQFIALKCSPYKRINIFKVVPEVCLKHTKKLQRSVVQQMVTSQRLPSFEVASKTRNKVLEYGRSHLDELEKFEKKISSSRNAKLVFGKLQYAPIALFTSGTAVQMELFSTRDRAI